jgi:hypothetical protein
VGFHPKPYNDLPGLRKPGRSDGTGAVVENANLPAILLGYRAEWFAVMKLLIIYEGISKTKGTSIKRSGVLKAIYSN